MKKFFALLALAALLLTAFAFPVLAEEPILGGWSAYTDNPTEIPTEALDALNAALSEYTDQKMRGKEHSKLREKLRAPIERVVTHKKQREQSR